MGDSVSEVQRRMSIAPNTYRELLYDLQYLLHCHNPYVRSFKSAIEAMASNMENFQVIIRADRAPQIEHRGRYNAPQVDEVAVLIVGQEFTKRDIVLRARDNTLKRVSEIHRSYDALQYPLIFSHGEDGYSINVPQVHPVTRVPQKKNCVSNGFLLLQASSQRKFQ